MLRTTAIKKPRVEFTISHDVDVTDTYRLTFYTYDIENDDGTQGRDMDVDMAFVSWGEAYDFAQAMI